MKSYRAALANSIRKRPGNKRRRKLDKAKIEKGLVEALRLKGGL